MSVNFSCPRVYVSLCMYVGDCLFAEFSGLFVDKALLVMESVFGDASVCGELLSWGNYDLN